MAGDESGQGDDDRQAGGDERPEGERKDENGGQEPDGLGVVRPGAGCGDGASGEPDAQGVGAGILHDRHDPVGLAGGERGVRERHGGVGNAIVGRDGARDLLGCPCRLDDGVDAAVNLIEKLARLRDVRGQGTRQLREGSRTRFGERLARRFRDVGDLLDAAEGGDHRIGVRLRHPRDGGEFVGRE